VQALTTPVTLAGVESSQRLRLNQLLNTSGKMGRGAGAQWCLVGRVAGVHNVLRCPVFTQPFQ
jgi:hypothetical protein